jgi:hypothetical protein
MFRLLSFPFIPFFLKSLHATGIFFSFSDCLYQTVDRVEVLHLVHVHTVHHECLPIITDGYRQREERHREEMQGEY